MRPWADVIDRIGVTLAASRDAATRPGELAKARRLADDAYWVEFESSDMETAVNKYLGFGRARRAGATVSCHQRGGSRRRGKAPARFGHGGPLPQDASRPDVGRDRAQRQGSDRPVADRRTRRPESGPNPRLDRLHNRIVRHDGAAGDPRAIGSSRSKSGFGASKRRPIAITATKPPPS